MTSDLDLRERHELCDLFLELGPEAPTLSGDWTTHDLAAHLVVRERDPLAGPGIMISALAGLTDKRMARAKEKHPYPELVELVRTGPPFGPMKPAPIRYAANMVEFFVHHEDVRRPAGRPQRTDRPDLDDALWDLLGRMGGLMVRKAGVKGVQVRLLRPDGQERRFGKGEVVTISGPPQELVLELYGRRSAAQVAYEGPEAAVAGVKAAEFGI
ncbi:MAG: TIGR03085 family metal-binding protein [Acidimicrobiales bacterium]